MDRAVEAQGRARIVAAARAWLGTPYRHQASLQGVGCDCLGLLRGVWREVVGEEPQIVPPYRPDWAEIGGEETLLAAARAHLTEIAAHDFQAGDVLLFRMAEGAPAKHCAIVAAREPQDAQARIIHAYWGRSVLESWLGPWWTRRIAGAFAFPQI